MNQLPAKKFNLLEAKMKEHNPPATETERILLSIKQKLHDLSINPNIIGVDSYVRLKTIDAVINNAVAEIHKKGETDDN